MHISDPEYLEQKVKEFTFWYHKIDLGNGVVTPGLDFEPIWNMIRKTREHIDYAGKRVLDIASFDGMWAFEAEKLGAKQVVATDVYYEQFNNFLFCREVLGSKVIPYYNTSPYDLYNRLDVFLQENWNEQKPYERMFDIVQHLGLLYHLRDPMLTLSQARSVIKPGGYLMIETAAVVNETDSFMLFNGIPPAKPRIYEDATTWWAPTILCLKELLRATLFEPVEESIQILGQQSFNDRIKSTFKTMSIKHPISRVSLVAKAVAPESVDKEYFRELARTYRNPGLAVDRLQSQAAP